MLSKKEKILKLCSRSIWLAHSSISKRAVNYSFQLPPSLWSHQSALSWKIYLKMSTVTLSMLLLLLSFGVAEVLLLKKKTLIIVNSSVIGGRVNGKLQLSSPLRVLSLTTMSLILEMQMVEFSLANLPNGLRF